MTTETMTVTLDPAWIAIVAQIAAFVWALSKLATTQKQHDSRITKVETFVKEDQESREKVAERLARIEVSLDRLVDLERQQLRAKGIQFGAPHSS